MSLSRRQFFSISALPLLVGAEDSAAETLSPEDGHYLRQLRLFYDYMAIHGDKPEAFIIHDNAMLRLARLFKVEPYYGEFSCPWGGDICGGASVPQNGIDASCLGSSIMYSFEWDSLAYTRSDPSDWVRKNPGVIAHLTWKPHFLKLPKRPTV